MVPGLKWIDFVNVVSGVEQVMLRRVLYKEMLVKMYLRPTSLEMGELELYRSSAGNLADARSLT